MIDSEEIPSAASFTWHRAYRLHKPTRNLLQCTPPKKIEDQKVDTVAYFFRGGGFKIISTFPLISIVFNT